jgi:nucleotide-binding universal stress UspA family protein
MFQSVLLVSDGHSDDSLAVRHAVRLGSQNGALLRALIVLPDLPRRLADLRQGMESMVRGRMRALLEQQGAPDVPLDVAWGGRLAVEAIHVALREGCDLLVKGAAGVPGQAGVEAVDMELLRKCPCPVLLVRPPPAGAVPGRIAVAVDAEPVHEQGQALARALLRTASALAKIEERPDGAGAESRATPVLAVACWDFPLESTLRHSGFISMSDDEIAGHIEDARTANRAAFDALLAAAGAGPFQPCHLRGRPDEAIPATVEAEGVDLLVMGTLARTGLPGLLLGNTAENVLRRLRCSLLALKPPGFVSPVRLG